MDNFTLPADVASIIARLTAAGHQVFIVGGCVRDILLKRCPNDYDLTTDATPDQVMAVFDGCDIGRQGLKHGTVTVIISHVPYEITTFRREGSYSDHRHPDSVAFSGSLTEDLARRDFTINAMAYSPSVGLIDPYGGRQDLCGGMVRCVGDPDERFTEDALRILRALRFAAVLGFDIEPCTAQAASRLRSLLNDISAERLATEMDKLLCGRGATDVLLRHQDIIFAFIPELEAMAGFDQHDPRHGRDLWTETVRTVGAVAPKSRLRWAALLHDAAKPSCMTLDAQGRSRFIDHDHLGAQLAQQVLGRLRFPNSLIADVVRLVANHDRQLDPATRSVAHVMAVMGSYEAFSDLLAIKAADEAAQDPRYRHGPSYYDDLRAQARQMLDLDIPLQPSDLKIGGEDLLARGYQGPAIGDRLRQLTQDVLDGRVPNQRPELLSWLDGHSK